MLYVSVTFLLLQCPATPWMNMLMPSRWHGVINVSSAGLVCFSLGVEHHVGERHTGSRWHHEPGATGHITTHQLPSSPWETGDTSDTSFMPWKRDTDNFHSLTSTLQRVQHRTSILSYAASTCLSDSNGIMSLSDPHGLQGGSVRQKLVEYVLRMVFLY